MDAIANCEAAQFQNLCDTFLRIKLFKGIKSYGLQDGNRKTKKGTPDSYCILENGEFVFFEYTTQKTSIGEKIIGDINKCLKIIKNPEKPLECKSIWFIANSDNISPQEINQAIKICSENSIDLRVIGLNELTNIIYNDYKIVAKDILNIDLSFSPICNIQEFVERNKNKFGTNYSTEIIGREKEIDEIKKLLDENDFVVVSGNSGVGKTKVTLEALKQLDFHTIIVENKPGSTVSDLFYELDKVNQAIVFFDDANLLNQLSQCIDILLFNSTRQIKTILTTRNYARQSVFSILQKYPNNIGSIDITIMDDESIAEMLKRNLNISNPEYLNRIIKISRGNPRIAMIAGEKTINESHGLEIWNDSASILSSYYLDKIKELFKNDYDKYRDVLGMIAFLKRFDLDSLEKIEDISNFMSISISNIRSYCYDLYYMEIVDIFKDRIVSINDQCLQDFFINDTFISRKSVKINDFICKFFFKYKSEIIEMLNCLIGIYTSNKTNEYLKNEILGAWDKLENSNNLTGEFILTFCPFDINRAAKWCGSNMFNNCHKNSTDFAIKKSTYQSSNVYLDILENISVHEVHSKSILLLLEALSYEETRESACDKIFKIFSPHKDDFDDGFKRQKLFISLLLRFKTQIWFKYVLIETCKLLLKFDFNYYESNKKNEITCMMININDNNTSFIELRNIVWDTFKYLDNDEIYHLIDGYFKRRPDDNAINVFLNDISNIENILSQLTARDEVFEQVIYAHSLYSFFKIKKKWIYMDNLYEEKFQLIELILNPREDNEDFTDRKNKWENNVITLGNKCDLEETKTILNLISKIHKIEEINWKIIEFTNHFIPSLRKEIILWMIENLTSIIKPYNGNIIFLLGQKLTKLFEYNEAVTLLKNIQNNPYKIELIAAYLSNLEKANVDESHRILHKELFEYDYRKDVEHNIIVNRRTEILRKFSKNDDEFVYYLDFIYKNYDNNKIVSNQYFEFLFNEHCFSNDELNLIFNNVEKINIFENIYLKHLQDRNFDYRASHIFFWICSKDNNFFEKIALLSLTKEYEYTLKVFDEIWEQPNCFDYATRLFEIIIKNANKNYFINFKIRKLFAVDFDDNHQNDELVVKWAISILPKYVQSKDVITLSKIVSNTRKSFNINFYYQAIVQDISIENFKSLYFEPLTQSWSGSYVPILNNRINYYNELINRLVDYVKYQEIIEFINDKIDIIKNEMYLTEIKENLESSI